MSDSHLDLTEFSMLELFRVEVETQVGILTEGLLQIEQDAKQYKLEELMRAAHSIKGAARMVDILPVVAIAHAMEDCFVAAQAGDLLLQAEHIDHFLRSIDLIQQIAAVQDGDLANWLATHQDNVDDNVAQSLAYLSQTKSQQSDEGVVPAALPAGSVSAKPLTAASAATTQSVSAPLEPDANSEQDAVLASLVSKTSAASDQAVSDLSVRVSATCFDRLLAIAGESLVESRRLVPYTRLMARLKQQQGRLSASLVRLSEKMVQQGVSSELICLLGEAQQYLTQGRSALGQRIEELEQLERRSSNIAENLHRELISSRMRPFAEAVGGLQRKLRDIARELGKQVELDIRGLNTLVDREVLERIKSPLDHILRNAVDHGIEFPAEREQAGKTSGGTITLDAFHRAGMLSIVIKDNGRGVDFDKLRHCIVKKGLTNQTMAYALTDAELLEFLYLPGFSTCHQVTEMSGRGVGMDAVMTVIKEMNGVIHIHNDPGQGFQLHIQLPLSLSVMRALLVEVGGEAYAFPLSRIERVEKIAASSVQTLSGQPYVVIEERNISLVSASQILQTGCFMAATDVLSVVVMGDRQATYGIVVERFIGERELVVQTLDSRLGKIKDISAAATLDDGRMCLICDVEDMLNSIAKVFGTETVSIDSVRTNAAAGPEQRKRILVVDDSMTVREVERKLLRSCGYEVDVAVDGVDAWNSLRASHYELVVTDVDMPRMNGIELLEKIKGDARYSRLPVVIVSYKDGEGDRERGLSAGADYYLTKGSFHDDTLRDAVVDLIGEVAA